MPESSVALLQGSLDLVVLKTLTWQPMHGFGIARRIQRLTDDTLQVEEGSLYPALYRLENRGLIKAEVRLHTSAVRSSQLSPSHRPIAATLDLWGRAVPAYCQAEARLRLP